MTSPIEQLHEDKIIIQNDVIFIQTFTEKIRVLCHTLKTQKTPLMLFDNYYT